MNEDVKPSREPQRRLNPSLREVVRKEIIKLLDSGIIYLISDSQWILPLHLVPKKTGITVETNEKCELVTKRITNSWRVCVDLKS